MKAYEDDVNMLWLKRIFHYFGGYAPQSVRNEAGIVVDTEGRKHIAIRARSTNRKRAPFVAPGLGDRIHCITLGWAFSKAHGVPVVLHLNRKKHTGGASIGNKRESWNEVLGLFPKGHVELMFHDFEPRTERSWISYLEVCGFPAEIFWYQDHPGKFETPQPLEISQYLKAIPPVPAEDLSHELNLPSRFVTLQWDSMQFGRTLPPEQQEEVTECYRREGYDVVAVGGKAPDPLLKNSLRHIAYAMSKAELHVGVDSAFMHMALLYLPPARIHLYNRSKGFQSHHLMRALDSGCILNHHYADQ